MTYELVLMKMLVLIIFESLNLNIILISLLYVIFWIFTSIKRFLIGSLRFPRLLKGFNYNFLNYKRFLKLPWTLKKKNLLHDNIKNSVQYLMWNILLHGSKYRISLVTCNSDYIQLGEKVRCYYAVLHIYTLEWL